LFFNLFDSHTHSEHSPDAAHPVRKMAASALEKGLSGIAITDHCEAQNWQEHGVYGKGIAGSTQAVLQAREEFRGRLDVAMAVELGQGHRSPGQMNELLARYPFDFVIGSVHNILGWPDMHTANCSWMGLSTLDELMHSYFDELERMVAWGGFDVVGHLSYPLRGAKHNSDVDIDISRYHDRTDRLFRALVHKGKGIEINTSGLRGPLEETMPPMSTLRHYREVGGEIITIGSDSHCSCDVGKGLQTAMGMLRRAGFQYFSFYRERVPVMLRVL